MIEIILILVFTYMLLLLEKSATVNVGGERGAFCSIDLCKEKKLYAPFKYRPLGFWLARLFNITSRGIETLMVWGERYSYNIYLLNSTGLEKYYIFKYALFLFTNFTFYWYMSLLGLPALIGVIVLDMFLALTFIYDSYDYLIEIGLYALFMCFAINSWNPLFLFLIAFLGGLNRESAVFMIPLAFCYASLGGFFATILGFACGFTLPRFLYSKSADAYDDIYWSGFRFLTFNPIKNWKHSIWPPLKNRFQALYSEFFVKYNGIELKPVINSRPIVTLTKERFLNRIFLGIAFLIFSFMLLISGLIMLPVFYRPMIYIFGIFILLISLPADIREIRVYVPALLILIPCLLLL
jgi:hypothetical protein